MTYEQLENEFIDAIANKVSYQNIATVGDVEVFVSWSHTTRHYIFEAWRGKKYIKYSEMFTDLLASGMLARFKTVQKLIAE